MNAQPPQAQAPLTSRVRRSSTWQGRASHHEGAEAVECSSKFSCQRLDRARGMDSSTTAPSASSGPANSFELGITSSLVQQLAQHKRSTLPKVAHRPLHVEVRPSKLHLRNRSVAATEPPATGASAEKALAW